MHTFLIEGWRDIERGPLSAEYEDLEGEEWSRFVANMKAVGFLSCYPIFIRNGKIDEGWQRLRACKINNLTPTFAEFPTDVDPRLFVQSVNDERRHDSPEKVLKRLTARRERVAKARQQGESLRTIADNEGKSEKTIRRDLEKSTADGYAVEPIGGVVIGQDNKKRPAKQPKERKLCGHCTHKKSIGRELPTTCEECTALNKPAKAPRAKPAPAPIDPDAPPPAAPLYDMLPALKSIAHVNSSVRDCGSAYNQESSPTVNELRKDLADFRKSFVKWHKSLSEPQQGGLNF